MYIVCSNGCLTAHQRNLAIARIRNYSLGVDRKEEGTDERKPESARKKRGGPKAVACECSAKTGGPRVGTPTHNWAREACRVHRAPNCLRQFPPHICTSQNNI